ncbi:hypothetical protein [Thermobifida fusca]|uniref:hypothetical protein n=1 Tax=Thermobifida fusca TaxID=2021 RepID=UPI001D0C4A42|nr:hypothetical protein [Thermobifida fusca]
MSEDREGWANPTAEAGGLRPRISIKAEVGCGAALDLAGALEIEASLQDQCVETADHLQAALAFLEQRQPAFRGC